jgi:S1-C subfamily serine protease
VRGIVTRGPLQLQRVVCAQGSEARCLALVARCIFRLSLSSSGFLLLLGLSFNSHMFGQDCSDLIRQNRLSVVHIQAEKTLKTSGAVKVVGATGFIVSASGVVLTNKHVVAQDPDVDEVKVAAAVGSQAAQLEPMHLLAVSNAADVAILQFNDTSKTWRPVAIGNPWLMDVDHPFCSMSFPLDIEFLMTKGNLSGKGAPNGWWYASLASNPGDSGAPVFDAADGKVVALKVGDRDDAKGLSYLIPINLASTLLSDFAGLDVPHEHDLVDAARPNAYTNPEVSCTISNVPFSRGYCAVTQCPHGQWVRGSATLLKTGDVVLRQGLETDRLDLGICGWVQFQLLDAAHSTIGYGYNQERCIPAKTPGGARIEDLAPDHVRVPAPIANKVATIELSSFCAGDVFAPLGLGGNSAPRKGTISIVIGAPQSR